MGSSFAADEPPGRVDCLINNLNDAVAWGLFPILFSTHHLSLTQIGLLGALYPAFARLRSSAPTASATSG